MIINGYVRDTDELAKMPLGVMALGAFPQRSFDKQPGQISVQVSFLGAEFRPGQWVYADSDGVVVAVSEIA